MKGNRKKNIILVLAFAAVCAVCAAAVFVFSLSAGSTAVIYSDGREIRRIDLDKVREPYELEVTTEYGVNTVRVEHGRICVTDADCPDKICVKSGYTDSPAAPIVCLPHRLSVVIEAKEGAADAVVGN